ncbi:putative kinetochore protein SPC24 [Candida viswanathii]|uniref:Kinetochore protein Spc24 n=1 Tax=Candida viswanathii TaxID=5486 RepID=A0A367YMD5_9ASCO|nr:putative kinetochore protein SPC24 [Candida viswanathii]
MTSLEKLNKITSEINIQDELQMLEEINNSIKNLELIRKSKVAELTTKTTSLTNQINQITKEINHLNQITDEAYDKLSIPSTAPVRKSSNVFSAILEKKQELDNLKVKIIKESQALNTSISNLTIEERRLAVELQDVTDKISKVQEEFENSASMAEQDPALLRISLMRRLGIELTSGDKDGGDTVLITNSTNNKRDILKVEPKLSDFFISNHIWDKL